MSSLGHETFVSKIMDSEQACVWIQMHKIVKGNNQNFGGLLFLDAFSLDKLWINIYKYKYYSGRKRKCFSTSSNQG